MTWSSIVLRLTSSLLRRRGFDVVTATDGAHALSRMDLNDGPAFDVVLLDKEMPVMDGHEAATEITKRFGPWEEPGVGGPLLLGLTGNAMVGLPRSLPVHLTSPG